MGNDSWSASNWAPLQVSPSLFRRGLEVGIARACLLILFLMATLAAGLTGCGSGSTAATSTTAPVIGSLAPTTAFPGTAITISGTNFGATQGTSTISFTGSLTTPTPTTWTANSIVVNVPVDAQTGNVTVTVLGVVSNGILFTVNPAPNITGLSQTFGGIGTSITINGVNFGTTQGTSTLTFNGTTATPTIWSNTSITVPVPTGATSGSLTVTVGGLGSDAFFTVQPVITALSAASGTVGTAITITGTNFGGTSENSVVTFNGTTATTLSATTTSIVTAVPTGASIGAGSVVVTVLGAASNGKSFTVTSGAVSGCGTGSEALLKGSYAYLLSGFLGGGVGTPTARVGSFTANGAGAITAGEEDFNQSTAVPHHTILAAGSSYSVGPDDRGCLTLAYSDATTATFRFSLAALTTASPVVATRGRIIQFDDTSGAGNRGSGILLQQTTTAFAASALQSNYAFGMQGFDSTGGHVAEGGTFAFAPASAGTNVTNGYFDYNDAGSMPYAGTNGTNGLSTGGIAATAISATTGRTTGSFTAEAACAATCTYHWAVYVVNAAQFLLVSTDTLGTNTPLVAGRAIQTGTTFSVSSSLLNSGNGYIVELTGASSTGVPTTGLDLLTFLAAGTFSGPGWSYTSPTPALTATPLSGTYAIGTTGRVTLSVVTGHLPVLYLTTPTAAAGIAGFVVGTDSVASFGIAEAQTSQVITSGRYSFGTINPAASTVPNQNGAETFQQGLVGSVTTNVAGGTTDQSAQSGLSTFTFSNVVYSLIANGSGQAPDNNGGTIIAIANGTAIYFIDENTTRGASAVPAVITVGEQ